MRRRIAVVFAVLLVALVPLAGCGRDQAAVAGTEVLGSAERPEPLALSGTTLDGEPFDLADLRGRIVVLNAWASWCTPCRAETPDLVALSATSDPDDIAVVGLNVTDDADAARAFVEEFDVPYPNLSDPDGALLRTVPGVPPASLPSTVILDREGRIAARVIGMTDAIELGTLIAQVVRQDVAG